MSWHVCLYLSLLLVWIACPRTWSFLWLAYSSINSSFPDNFWSQRFLFNRTFPSFQKVLSCPFTVSALHSFLTQANSAFCRYSFTFLEFHINRVMQYIVTCVWCLFLSTMLLKLIFLWLKIFHCMDGCTTTWFCPFTSWWTFRLFAVWGSQE